MKRLSKNFLSLLLSDVARRLLGFLAVAYLARTIGLYGFGALSLALTVLSYVIMVSSGGLHVLGTREIARMDSPTLVGEILGVRLVNSLAAFAILFAVCYFVLRDDVVARLILITCSAAFFQSLFLEWYFQGKEEMVVFSRARTASALLYLLVLVVFVRSVNDLMLAAVAGPVGDMLAAVLMWKAYERRQGPLRISLTPARWVSLMKQAFPMGSGFVLAHVSINLPPIILGILFTASEVGIFSAASKLVFFLLMIDRIVATLLLPASVRLRTESVEALSSTLTTAMKWIILLGLPLSLGGMVLASKLFEIIFGGAFADSALVFRVMVWYFFLTMLHSVYMTGLLALRKEKEFGKVMAVSAAVYTVLCVVLTRWFGAPGAALGVVLSEGVTVVLMRKKLLDYLPLVSPNSVVRIMFASAAMAALLLVFPNLHAAIAVVGGAAFYGAAVYGIRAVTREEILALGRRMA
ncbi:MAG: flippase [Bacteroidota bacterium]